MFCDFKVTGRHGGGSGGYSSTGQWSSKFPLWEKAELSGGEDGAGAREGDPGPGMWRRPGKCCVGVRGHWLGQAHCVQPSQAFNVVLNCYRHLLLSPYKPKLLMLLESFWFPSPEITRGPLWDRDLSRATIVSWWDASPVFCHQKLTCVVSRGSAETSVSSWLALHLRSETRKLPSSLAGCWSHWEEASG